VLCIIATIYTACSPGDEFSIESFFQETLALPLVLLLYVVWKVWKKTSIVKASEADLISGRRELDLHEEKEKEALERQTWSPFKRSVPHRLNLTAGFTCSFVNNFLSGYIRGISFYANIQCLFNGSAPTARIPFDC